MALKTSDDSRTTSAHKPPESNKSVSATDMASVQVPTLGLIGSADANLPAMQHLVSILPTLKVVVIEGATHGSPLGVGEPARSGLFVPLISGRRPIGVIALDNLDREHAYTDADQRLPEPDDIVGQPPG